MKQILLTPLLILTLAACGANAGPEKTPGYDQETYQEITITAGDSVIDGVLFNNDTACGLAAQRIPSPKSRLNAS